MWSKEASKIAMFGKATPGDFIKVIEWQYLREHSIVNLKQAELMPLNQPSGTQQMNAYANQRNPNANNNNNTNNSMNNNNTNNN